MTNKENFLLLVDPISEESKNKLNFRIKNRNWLRESQRIATDVVFAMKEKFISKEQLSDILDVNIQYIENLVKGKENITLDIIIKLQNNLGIKILK